MDFLTKKWGCIQEKPQKQDFSITWGSIQEWGCNQADTVCYFQGIHGRSEHMYGMEEFPLLY